MTRRRKILTATFLVFFLFGALALVDGSVAGAFIYWFILAVLFTGLWFLLGPTSDHSMSARVSVPNPNAGLPQAPPTMRPPPLPAGPLSKAKVFWACFAKVFGTIWVLGCILGLLADGAYGLASAMAGGIITGSFWGTVVGLYRISRMK